MIAEKVGDTTTHYFYGAQGIMGFEQSGKVYYYIKNILGDVTAIIDANGALLAKYVYDAWGNHKVLNYNGTENTDPNFIGNINPIRYRGYYYDIETELYYLQSRYYDPIFKRFITADDVSYLDPFSIYGLNLYAYCANNPVMYVDPEGTFIISGTVFKHWHYYFPKYWGIIFSSLFGLYTSEDN